MGAVGLMLCGLVVSFYGYRQQAETLAQIGTKEGQEKRGGEIKAGTGISVGSVTTESITTESITAESKTARESDGQLPTEPVSEQESESQSETAAQKDYIRWVDFNVSYQALRDTYRQDVETHGTQRQVNWIELLAYLATRNGGDFSAYQTKDLDALLQKLWEEGQTMEALTRDLKYYPYYLEAYTAVLGGMVGEYEIEVPEEGNPEKTHWETKYGLRAFSPVAKGYEYSDYDDFGVARSYGYRRQHLGHDMMGQTGTPIIAIESGYVEAIGWNQYGGWRIGIRSFDKKRYYYYAHLRQNFPFQKSLKEGSIVTAGDVIGYMGHTGYSTKENVNNIDETHLHWGLQLIFDESQKEGIHEIWIDCYALTRFLSHNRCATKKNMETKEYSRIYQMKIPEVTEKKKEQETEN